MRWLNKFNAMGHGYVQVQIELDPKPFRQSSDQHEPQISAFNDLRIN